MEFFKPLLTIVENSVAVMAITLTSAQDWNSVLTVFLQVTIALTALVKAAIELKSFFKNKNKPKKNE